MTAQDLGEHKMRKGLIIPLTVLLVTSIFTSFVLAAEQPRTVRGYVYINGVITKPDKVVLSIAGQQITAKLSDHEYGYYMIDFSAEDGETGSFTVTVDGNDYLAEETITTEHDVYLYHINLTVNDRCPDQPSNPSPADGSKVYSTSVTLSVDVYDPDGDTMTVSFYTSDGSLIGSDTVSGSGRASVTWSGLSYGTTYSWYAVADDGSCEKSSDIWSFTAEKKSSGSQNTGGGGGGGETTNEPPVAVISQPEDGAEVMNGTEVEFNASDSYDPNGDIIWYRWDFDGDGNWDTGWLSDPIAGYVYTSPGTYTIVLMVEDVFHENDTDSITLNVIESIQPKFNYPPSDPVIDGPTSGYVNETYTFTLSSTDPDNDNIQYIIDWGDGTNSTTDFVPNGTSVQRSHSWHDAGEYTISVTAFDNSTYSGASHHTITIQIQSQEPSNNSGEETQESEENYNLYIAVLAILILLAIALVVWKRTKQKK